MGFIIFVVIIFVIWFIVKPKKTDININSQENLTDKKKQAFAYIHNTLDSIITENTVILDTETTGLSDSAQVIELCILDIQGNILLNTYVKPKRKMGANNSAIAVHGITNEMLADAPTWDKIHQQVCDILQGKMVVTYNAQFDLRLIEQTMAKYDLEMPDCTFECAMNVYTSYQLIANNDEKPQRYKLTTACANLGIIPVGQAHRAYTDCQMTLDLLKAIHKITS